MTDEFKTKTMNYSVVRYGPRISCQCKWRIFKVPNHGRCKRSLRSATCIRVEATRRAQLRIVRHRKATRHRRWWQWRETRESTVHSAHLSVTWMSDGQRNCKSLRMDFTLNGPSSTPSEFHVFQETTATVKTARVSKRRAVLPRR